LRGITFEVSHSHSKICSRKPRTSPAFSARPAKVDGLEPVGRAIVEPVDAGPLIAHRDRASVELWILVLQSGVAIGGKLRALDG